MIDWLFDTTGFPTRGDCCIHGTDNPWTQAFVISTIVANLGIALAYYINPICLVYIWRKIRPSKRIGRDIGKPVRALFIIYALFIFACGTGHLWSNVIVFYWPSYHFFTAWDWFTCCISWVANISLVLTWIWYKRTFEEENGHG